MVKPLHVFEVLVALALLSWSVTRHPVVVCVSRMSVYLFNPLVNFVIGNAIVILLLFIYRKNGGGLNSGSNELPYEYFQSTEVSDTPETEDENNHNAIEALVNIQNQFRLQSIEKTEEINANVDGDKKIKVIEVAENVHQIRRAKSELLNSKGRVQTQKKLRQTDSDISSVAVLSYETVDKLSSEEFKHTVEAFIAKHQRFLWKQKMNEDK